MHALLRGAMHLSRCRCRAPLSVRAAAEPTQESSRKRTKWSVSVAAGALIDSQGRLLLVQRAAGDRYALKYEFPGGKVEQGESPAAALVRELREELGVTVNIQDCFPVSFSTKEEKKMHLLLLLYVVRRWTGTPSCVEGQPGLAWVTPEELGTQQFPMPPLDEPVLPAVRAEMRVAAESNEPAAAATRDAR